MHEVALMEELLRIAQEEARLAGGGRVRRVRLEVGALAGVDPDALRFAFEALAPERLGSARLDLVESPGRAWCEACRAEVLAHFSSKYGEKILSAPTASGFNLIAWVTPFAAVLVAGAVIVVVSRRWRRPASASPSPSPAPVDDARRARLEAELDRFDA